MGKCVHSPGCFLDSITLVLHEHDAVSQMNITIYDISWLLVDPVSEIKMYSLRADSRVQES